MLNLVSKKTLKSALLAGTAASAALVAMTGVATAQQAETAPSVEKVTVTGTRIKQRDFKSISPIATVSSKDLTMTGSVNVESLLNELPQITPGLTISSNNPSLNGFATADLRGLGPGRTLVLVNGRRANPSDRSGAVDLNTIPLVLVDRVEIISGGASAVYGADAVAGAINFIMKDDYEGIQLGANYSQAEDGEAPAVTLDGVIGGTFAGDRGSLMAGFQYYNRSSVGAEKRDWSRNTRAVGLDAFGNTFLTTNSSDINNGTNTLFNPAGSGTAPWASVTGGFSTANITTVTGLTLDADCNPANGTQSTGGTIRFNAAGGIEPFQNCPIDSNNSQSGPAALGDRYDFAPDNFLVLENERFNGAVFGKYDILPNDEMTAFVEAVFTNSRSKQQLAATPVTGLTVRVDLDPTAGVAINPYVSANAQLLALLNLQYAGNLDGRTLTMNIRPNQGGLREGIAETNAIGITSGFRGTMPSIDWDWEVFHSFARNTTNIMANNNVGKTAITQLINACGVTSNAVQPAPLTALPNCPFPNLSGSTFVPTGNTNNPLGLNSMNAAQLAFINVDTTDVQIYERTTFGASATGDVADLWGEGPLAMAVGAEYRSEALESRADPFKAAGDIFGFNAQESIAGEFDVYELFAEATLPIITGETLFENLSLTGGYRKSDYSTGADITETWKYGAEWSPFSWLSFRAVENHAVRAPTAFELFQAGDQNFPGYGDPCNTAAINLLAVADRAARVATCTAWFAAGGGVYPGYVLPGPNPVNFVQVNSQVEAFQIGTSNLDPEIADTLTYGVVFNPDWWPVGRLGVSVDRYEIEVAGVIALRSIANILNGCLAAGGVPVPPPGNDCNLAPRQADGQIDFVNQTRSNSQALVTKGVDVNLRWSLDLEDTVGLPGTFGVASLYTWTDTYLSWNPAVTSNPGENVGTHDGTIGGGIPEHKAATNFTYAVGDFDFLVRWTYASEMEQASFGTEIVEAYNLYDIAGTWNIDGNLQASFGVDNLLDEQPQMFTDAQVFGQFNVDGSAQDQLGRSFRFGLTWKN